MTDIALNDVKYTHISNLQCNPTCSGLSEQNLKFIDCKIVCMPID